MLKSNLGGTMRALFCVFFVTLPAFLIFCAVPAFAADLPYKDGDFACFSQTEANRYLRDFNVDTASFGGLELCHSAKDTKKLLNDLYLIEKAEFTPDASHVLIRNVVPANNYYGWMKSQTRGMNRGNDIPWATAYNSGGYFTMQDGWAALSTLGRVGTVIHEARHTAGYRHYPCTHGPYGGTSMAGCDTSISQQGSHGVEMEYYTRVVLDAKNLHPVYQSMARLMALGRTNFVFNESPIRPREGLLARAGSEMVLVDGAQVYAREAPAAPAEAMLKRTSFGASLVSGQKAVAVDVYSPSANGASVADDYSYYKLFTTPRPSAPQETNDIEEIDLGSLRYFAVLGEQGKIYSYNFPGGGWHPATAANPGAAAFVTRAPNGQAGLFVVKNDGSILPFHLANRRFDSPLRERWTADTRAYAMNGAQLVRLASDGQVLDAATGAPVPAFAGKRVSDLVNIPLYDAYEIHR